MVEILNELLVSVLSATPKYSHENRYKWLLGVLLLIFLLAVIIALCWPNDKRTPTGTHPHRCILLIGGFPVGNQTAEYYHPVEGVECDIESIGNLSHPTIAHTTDTAGCYLSGTQQIVTRERHPSKPPMLYGLRDESAIQLPLPFKDSSWASTGASISASVCLSCGGKSPSIRAMAGCYQFDSSSPTKWTEIPATPTHLSHSASVALGDDNYYVIGGDFHGHDSVSKQLFRYSPSERKWSEEPSMFERRSTHSAAMLSSSEFIVCGRWPCGSDCEVYNTRRKQWRRVGSLNICRDYFAILNFNRRIYAVGGLGSNDVPLDSVEEYNVQTEKWTMTEKKLKRGRRSFVALVV